MRPRHTDDPVSDRGDGALCGETKSPSHPSLPSKDDGVIPIWITGLFLGASLAFLVAAQSGMSAQAMLKCSVGCGLLVSMYLVISGLLSE